MISLFCRVTKFGLLLTALLLVASLSLAFLHSFPTRRSSDLVILQLNKNGSQYGDFEFVVGAATQKPVNCVYSDLVSLADRKSTRLNSSHRCISYAVFCLNKKSSLR